MGELGLAMNVLPSSLASIVRDVLLPWVIQRRMYSYIRNMDQQQNCIDSGTVVAINVAVNEVAPGLLFARPGSHSKA